MYAWMWFGARLIRCSSNLPINKFAYAGLFKKLVPGHNTVPNHKATIEIIAGSMTL